MCLSPGRPARAAAQQQVEPALLVQNLAVLAARAAYASGTASKLRATARWSSPARDGRWRARRCGDVAAPGRAASRGRARVSARLLPRIGRHGCIKAAANRARPPPNWECCGSDLAVVMASAVSAANQKFEKCAFSSRITAGGSSIEDSANAGGPREFQPASFQRDDRSLSFSATSRPPVLHHGSTRVAGIRNGKRLQNAARCLGRRRAEPSPDFLRWRSHSHWHSALD